jgi:hypothetical protein
MTKQHLVVALAGLGCLALGWVGAELVTAQDDGAEPQTRLAVLWTSGDPEVAHRMLLMYVNASQRAGWFDENLIIIWGPSSRLVAADKDLQAKIKAMAEAGVRFQACIACADSYGVTGTLRELGVEVKGMGAPLTRLLQDDDWDVITI